MPANPKYLQKSSWQAFAKISAGIIGGYILTALLHLCLPLYLPNPKEVLITGIYTVFLVWTLFLILPFLFKNGWKVWLLYIIIAIVLYSLYSLGIKNNPFI